MKYFSLYSFIIAFFSLHIIFNVVNKNNISEINSFSWVLILISFGGFIWTIYYTKVTILKYKFISYILSVIGILLAFAQVTSWVLYKDFGF